MSECEVSALCLAAERCCCSHCLLPLHSLPRSQPPVSLKTRFFSPLVGCCVCARQSNNSSSSKPGRLTGISHCCRPLPPPILYLSFRVLLSFRGLHNEKHFCPSFSHNGSFQHTPMLNVNKLCGTRAHVHGGVQHLILTWLFFYFKPLNPQDQKKNKGIQTNNVKIIYWIFPCRNHSLFDTNVRFMANECIDFSKTKVSGTKPLESRLGWWSNLLTLIRAAAAWNITNAPLKLGLVTSAFALFSDDQI